MDAKQFVAQLEQDGYREIETKMLQPRPANHQHEHGYSVRGLVLDGEFIVTCGGEPHSYRPGDVFEVAAGLLHDEAVGPRGAHIVVGRKY